MQKGFCLQDCPIVYDGAAAVSHSDTHTTEGNALWSKPNLTRLKKKWGVFTSLSSTMS